ncbi:MAG: caspase family protein [Rhodomicrobium sp.]
MSVVRAFFAAAVFLIANACAVLADAPKLALIVTNKAYPASIGALEKTHRDGERMAAALTALGFTVVHKRDLDKAAMLSEVSDYVVRLEKAGPEAIGFFYYSGHGAANSKYGENYLIPVAAPITSDAQLPLQAVKLGEIIDSIAATSAKANFLVFDACRNVPITFAAKSQDKGLRTVQQRRGILVAFATDPGKTAADEGVYAEALAEEMQKPGVPATEVFRSVRSRVLAATENRQFPWIEDGLIENIYFAQPQAENPPPTLITPLLSKRFIEDCDHYAASPKDPGRSRYGVEFEEIDIAKALPACEAASTAQPLEKRFRYQLARTLHAAGDFVRARELYRELSKEGHVAATFNLGYMFYNGDGGDQDKVEAARLFRKAADLGDGSAMDGLAVLYDNGEGVKEDAHVAAELIFSAIKKGNDITLKRSPFADWSLPFRRELERLLKEEGVYSGPIDGNANNELKKAVEILANRKRPSPIMQMPRRASQGEAPAHHRNGGSVGGAPPGLGGGVGVGGL